MSNTTSRNWLFQVNGSGVTGRVGNLELWRETGVPIIAFQPDGDVGIGRTSPGFPLHMASGAHVTIGGAWVNESDRNSKRLFKRVDKKEVLRSVVELPISEWGYKSEPASVRHIGPMAQDFHAAFGLGNDDKHITTIDTDGVALAAIQGLYEIVQEKEAEIVRQAGRIEEQGKDIAELRARLAALEDTMRKSSPSARASTFGMAVPGLGMIGLLGLLAIARSRRAGAR